MLKLLIHLDACSTQDLKRLDYLQTENIYGLKDPLQAVYPISIPEIGEKLKINKTSIISQIYRILTINSKLFDMTSPPLITPS